MRAKTLLSSIATTVALTIALTPGGLIASHNAWSDWRLATPVAEVNDPNFPDGCPIESRDGLSLYIASTRPGATSFGGNDIWAADRPSKDAPFSAPTNLGGPVNTGAADFCPTPIHGSYLLFVSDRPGLETCNAGPGRGDMYIVRRNAAFGWGTPRHLGCVENGTGPNSAAAEFSPSLVNTPEGTFLYFSSCRGSDGAPCATATGLQDIFKSQQRRDGSFGPPTPVRELNTPDYDDRMPNVSADGLEIVFSSTRPVDAEGYPSLGSQDVFVSRRRSTRQRWSVPVNLGDNVNTSGSETRATMSWDGKRLYFGRDGEIYSSSRARERRHH